MLNQSLSEMDFSFRSTQVLYNLFMVLAIYGVNFFVLFGNQTAPWLAYIGKSLCFLINGCLVLGVWKLNYFYPLRYFVKEWYRKRFHFKMI